MRDAYLAPLHYLQVALIERWRAERAAGREPDSDVARALLLTRQRHRGRPAQHRLTAFADDLHGRQRPEMPSPISLAPITRKSTAMIAALLWPIQSLRSSSMCAARSPIRK